MIDEWRIVVSGFTQDMLNPSGSERLWKRMHESHAGSKSVVLWKLWSENWHKLSEHMYRLKNGSMPVVDLFGYSYGGDGVIRLARNLQTAGIDVRNMVLCDAVYRHRYWAGNWRSVLPWAELLVPENVKNVYVLKQENPRWQLGRPGGILQPAGHDVVAENEETTHIAVPQILPLTHARMDDAAEYHDLAMAVTGAKDE